MFILCIPSLMSLQDSERKQPSPNPNLHNDWENLSLLFRSWKVENGRYALRNCRKLHKF